MGHGSSFGPDKKTRQSRLGHVRGWGASGHGSQVWWLERITAFAAIPLSVYILVALLSGMGSSYEELLMWMSCPGNMTISILAVVALCWHGALALCTVVSDYVHTKSREIFASLAIKYGAIFLGTYCIVSILSIGLTGLNFKVLLGLE